MGRCAMTGSVTVPSMGLLGGMGPASTAHYYSKICRRYNEHFGGLRLPEIHVHSLDFERMNSWAASGLWHRVAQTLVAAATRMADAGVQSVALACNTMHMVIDQVADAIGIPVVSSVDVVIEAMQRRSLDRCRLLGTNSTLVNGFFQRAAAAQGLSLSEPHSDDRAELDDVIFGELTSGIVSARAVELVQRQLADAYAQGEGVVLACTELGLALDANQGSDARVIDSAEAHIAAIVRNLINASHPSLAVT